MNRIAWLRWPVAVLLYSAAVAAAALAAEPSTATTPAAREPRVLFITAQDSPKSQSELARLQCEGGEFQKLRTQGWKIGTGGDSHVQIVDRGEVVELVEKLHVTRFPTVACVSRGEILRSFTSGCTTPLDAWTFGFLLKGVDERPPGAVPEVARVESTGHYPLRGNHWSIDEDWNPTRSTVVSHLRGPAHGHSLLAAWSIESWSYEELRSLHDNLHEQEMRATGYSGRYAANRNDNPFAASRKAAGH